MCKDGQSAFAGVITMLLTNRNYDKIFLIQLVELILLFIKIHFGNMKESVIH
jgi:hypothetical protein